MGARTECRTRIEDYLMLCLDGIGIEPRGADRNAVGYLEFFVVLFPVVCPVFILDVLKTVKACSYRKILSYISKSCLYELDRVFGLHCLAGDIAVNGPDSLGIEEFLVLGAHPDKPVVKLCKICSDNDVGPVGVIDAVISIAERIVLHCVLEFERVRDRNAVTADLCKHLADRFRCFLSCPDCNLCPSHNLSLKKILELLEELRPLGVVPVRQGIVEICQELLLFTRKSRRNLDIELDSVVSLHIRVRFVGNTASS